MRSRFSPPGGSMAGAARRLPQRLSVEGNIAAGKSTFVGLLRRAFPGWHLTPEPVAKWQEVRAARQKTSPSPTAGNLLQMIYREPRRWSFTFQSYSCLSRLKAQLESAAAQSPEAVLLFERYIFAKNLFEVGHMTEMEWVIYQDWHNFLLQTFGDQLALQGFLYLRAPPEVCFERLHRRSRPEEKEVQLAYLQQLHVQHENWLVKKASGSHSGALGDAPVLVLDVTKDFENDPNEQRELVGQGVLDLRPQLSPKFLLPGNILVQAFGPIVQPFLPQLLSESLLKSSPLPLLFRRSQKGIT
ncbi:deoxyguanosine kinase, mitochondrial isoform X3 [Erythrolamprus reginae]|uniref:deoxyguanosine kinase, mitochondrial isoform X3 n=1 Tax=Erythrolamprus reginae TaxID=121349 RepID=UPI00396C7B32